MIQKYVNIKTNDLPILKTNHQYDYIIIITPIIYHSIYPILTF